MMKRRVFLQVVGAGAGVLALRRPLFAAAATATDQIFIFIHATGRHLAGGRPPASSIDVAIANELGTAQLLPDIAIGFPASYVGERLDRRAIPLRVASAGTIAKSLARSDAYLKDDDRAAITAVL